MGHKVNLLIQAAVVAAVVGFMGGYLGGRFTTARAGPLPSDRDAMADINASKRLRVAYIIFPPAVSEGPSADSPTGHMVDAARYIASEMKVKVSFQEATWATFAAGLQAKQYDVVVAPLFATPSRATVVAFTQPLYYLGMAIITKRGDTRFTSLSDLDNATVQIAVNQGGANQQFAKRYCPNAKLTELAADISQVLSEVVAGRADAAIADTWSVSKFARQNENAVQVLFSGEPLDVTAVSWAVRPEDTRLLRFLDTTIEYLHTTGKMAEFERKYDAHWLHAKREWERN
jgi:polar amino acid transport system substrate-binding protein